MVVPTGEKLGRYEIRSSMANRISHSLTLTQILVLSAAAIVALGMPLLVGVLDAQTSERLAFEVASIKRINSTTLPSGPRALAPGVTPDGGIRSTVPIFNLICWAYGIDGTLLSGGPAWVRDDRYAIEAKPPSTNENLTPNERTRQARERVKALLADRFRLALRTDAKDSSVYVLSVAPGGLKVSADPNATPGGISYRGDSIESNGAPISFLTVSLTQMLGRTVLDESGVEGRFKYKLEFRPESADVKRALAAAGEPVPDDDPRPSIFTALKSQLGLELKSRKAPVSALIIERIERPSEN